MERSASVTFRSACPIASGLDVLGDKWSLVVIRDLIVHEQRTYSEFLSAPEGISTNILALRLQQLTDLGLITRVNPNGPHRNNAYRLTDKGAALRPVLEELAKWSKVHLRALHPNILSLD